MDFSFGEREERERRYTQHIVLIPLVVLSLLFALGRQKMKGAQPIVTEGFEETDTNKPFLRLAELTDGFSVRYDQLISIQCISGYYFGLVVQCCPMC